MPIAFSSPGLRAHSLVILLFLLKYADFVVHTCSQMLPIAPSVIAVKIFNDGMLGAVVRCLCACSETAGLDPTLSATFQKELQAHKSLQITKSSEQPYERLSCELAPLHRDNVSVHIHCRPDVRVTHSRVFSKLLRQWDAIDVPPCVSAGEGVEIRPHSGINLPRNYDHSFCLLYIGVCGETPGGEIRNAAGWINRQHVSGFAPANIVGTEIEELTDDVPTGATVRATHTNGRPARQRVGSRNGRVFVVVVFCRYHCPAAVGRDRD